MLRIVTGFFVRLAERWMPDPLVVAVFLTYICLLAAVIFTDFGPVQVVNAWGASFWNLLQFTMQMVLILGLGHLVSVTCSRTPALFTGHWWALPIESPRPHGCTRPRSG